MRLTRADVNIPIGQDLERALEGCRERLGEVLAFFLLIETTRFVSKSCENVPR